MITRGFVQKLVNAWNSRSADKVMALYAPNAVVRDPIYPKPLRGIKAIRTDAENFFTAFPDLRFKAASVLAKGDKAAFEVTVTGTNRGNLVGPAGALPATNRKVRVGGAVLITVDRKNRIIHERRYFDVAGFMQQLGLTGAPPPPAAGQAPSADQPQMETVAQA